MRVVADASVAVKWLLPEPAVEPDADKAVALLAAAKDGRVELLQPPHWLAEVLAVITRLRPEIADEAVELLDAMELSVVSDVVVYKRASRMARTSKQHVFDTLYHAIAIEHNGLLVTSDERYLRGAGAFGSAIHLGQWVLPEAEHE